jgi:phage-related protein
MFKIILFRNKKGESSVRTRIAELKKKSATDKSARIALTKIHEYISVLKECGTRAGEKYTKHIEGDIWELRPMNDRIFFFSWIDKQIVLLHCFIKKTQKTPKKELDQAKRNLYSFLEDENEKR